MSNDEATHHRRTAFQLERTEDDRCERRSRIEKQRAITGFRRRRSASLRRRRPYTTAGPQLCRPAYADERLGRTGAPAEFENVTGAAVNELFTQSGLASGGDPLRMLSREADDQAWRGGTGVTTHDDFFQRKQAAAVLKHGILTRYPPIFATMTGLKSAGGRVVYLDGYAGPGRYDPEDGQTIGPPGSPLLAVRNAKTVAQWERDLHCIFIERNRTYASNLRQVLAEEASPTLAYDVIEGDLEERLDQALKIAGDSPLLAFLDPFGTALPYRQMTSQLMGRGRQLITEVLLNLNLEMVWRIGGYLTGEETDQEYTKAGRSATLERVDEFLGGDWWREAFLNARISGERGSAAHAAQYVAAQFQQRVRQETGYRSIAVPIRRRPAHPPLFLMILFYRHSAAPYQFNDAASGANADWRSHFRKVDLTEELAKQQSEPDLFGPDLVRELSESEAALIEKQLEDQWVKVIGDNVRMLIAAQPTIAIEAQVSAIYGTTLGLARTKHLRAAWDNLSAAGLVLPRDTRERHLRKLTIVRTR